MNRTILFEHIPKTGGITLRGILIKVYGEKKVFVINSNYPGSSLDRFKKLGDQEREKIKVVAGHGALLYESFLKNPFKIAILRHPVELFLSQFYYLKISKKDIFWEDVRKMQSPDEYLDYAVSMGQDNLMTRFLANSMEWTVNPEKSFHNLDKDGNELLQKAKSNLQNFDVVINLGDFDTGIYALSRLLNWKSIPLYKPSNRNPKKPGRKNPETQFLEKLKTVLRFDIELYDYFKNKNFDAAQHVDENRWVTNFLKTRQRLAAYRRPEPGEKLALPVLMLLSFFRFLFTTPVNQATVKINLALYHKIISMC